MGDGTVLKLILTAGLIAMASFVGGLFPKIAQKSKKIRLYLPMVLIFSIGLNLSIAFVDIMPEIAAGHSCSHDTGEESKEHSHGENTLERSTFFVSGLVILGLMAIEAFAIGEHSHGSHSGHSHGNHSGHSHESHTTDFDDKIQASCPVDNEDDHSNIIEQEENEVFNDHHFKSIDNSKSFFSIITILLSLSVHSFLEGLNFSHHAESYMHVFCLVLHKFFESIGLGMALFSGLLKFNLAILYLSIFSMITPLGILIGNVLSTYFKSKLLLNILNGSALGSLLYVIFIEGYASGLHGKHKYLKHLSSLSGYLIGSLVIFKAH